MQDNSKFSPETAKAIQEVAKTSQKALDVMDAFGRWVGKAIDYVPVNLVGVMGGDWLREFRIRRIDELTRRTTEILKERRSKCDPREANPVFLVSIFNSACDDNRSEIQEIWARLIANALDGNRPNIRKSFILIVNQLDTYDALILQKLSSEINPSGQIIIEKSKSVSNEYYHMANELRLSKDQWDVSIDQLFSLGILAVKRDHIYDNDTRTMSWYTQLSALGREFINACKL